MEKYDYMTIQLLQTARKKTSKHLILSFSLCISSVSSPGSSSFLFHHWYCVVVGFWLVVMTLAVCITHWKFKSNNETAVTHY